MSEEFKLDLNDPENISHVLDCIDNMYRQNSKSNAFICTMTLVNKLASMKQAKVLGLNVGIMTKIKRTTNPLDIFDSLLTPPSFMIWIGLGPINNQTNYFDTVMVINFRQLSPLDYALVVFDRLGEKDASHVAHVKKMVTEGQQAYEADFLVTGLEPEPTTPIDLGSGTANDEFQAFMQKLMNDN